MIVKSKIDFKIRTMYFHGSCLIVVTFGLYGLISRAEDERLWMVRKQLLDHGPEMLISGILYLTLQLFWACQIISTEVHWSATANLWFCLIIDAMSVLENVTYFRSLSRWPLPLLHMCAVVWKGINLVMTNIPESVDTALYQAYMAQIRN